MPYSYKQIAKKLQRSGYSILRQGKGSHVIFGKGTQRIIAPNHGGKDISPGVEKKIQKALGLTPEQFRKL